MLRLQNDQNDMAVTSFSTWLTTYEPKPSKQQTRLDTLLTYLSLMQLSHSQVHIFIARADALEQGMQTTQITQFDVKMDSLLIEVSHFIQLQKQQKQQQESLQDYQQVIQRLKPDNTSKMLRRIKHVLAMFAKQTTLEFDVEFDLDAFVQQAAEI